MAYLKAVQDGFQSLRKSGQIEKAFQGWKGRHEALDEYSSVEDLIHLFRAPEGGLVYEKNDALAALCEEVGEGDETAGILLVWIFIGAFRRIVGKIGRSPLSQDELESEMFVAFWEAAKANGSNAEMLTLRLFDAIRSAARRAVKQARREVSRKAEVDLEPAGPSPFVDNPALVVERARDEGIITDEEAEIIVATRLEGISVEEFGSQQDLTREAAGMRRMRAEEKLTTWLRP